MITKFYSEISIRFLSHIFNSLFEVKELGLWVVVNDLGLENKETTTMISSTVTTGAEKGRSPGVGNDTLKRQRDSSTLHKRNEELRLKSTVTETGYPTVFYTTSSLNFYVTSLI